MKLREKLWNKRQKEENLIACVERIAGFLKILGRAYKAVSYHLFLTIPEKK